MSALAQAFQKSGLRSDEDVKRIKEEVVSMERRRVEVIYSLSRMTRVIRALDRFLEEVKGKPHNKEQREMVKESHKTLRDTLKKRKILRKELYSIDQDIGKSK